MITRTTRRGALGAGLALLALTATACGGDRGATVQGARLIEKGHITTCTHLPYPPFQSVRGGRVAGLDVDLIDLVAKRLGVTQKIVNTPFEAIRSGAALDAGKCDVAAAAMTIRPDRAQSVDFSKPYFEATLALMGRKGRTYASVGAVKAAEKLRIGTRASTAGAAYAHEQKIDSISFADPAALLGGLRGGRVDVVIEDYPVVRGWLRDPANRAYAVVGDFDTGERYGFAVRKDGNAGLLELINRTIEESRSDGRYRAIHEKWIGPLPATAAWRRDREKTGVRAGSGGKAS